MAANRQTQFDGQFIDGSQGRILVVRHYPAPETAPRGVILCAPPFAEELNCSRRMLALQARAFAQLGYEVLLPDLGGCGDSEGDFADATWAGWLDDLRMSWEWLQGNVQLPISLWGMRAGALLIADLLRRDHLQPAHAVLWQPTVRGESILNEFLRVVLTSQMLGSQVTHMTLKEMRTRLSGGEALDVAGYRLNPELAESLASASLLEPPPIRCETVWLEVSSVPERGLGATSQQVIESWGGADISVESFVVEGPRFWNTAEITECPAIIDATCRWLVRVAP